MTNSATSEKAAALQGHMRNAGTLQFEEMAEGDMSDAYKTVKAVDEKNADQVFHKCYNTRHQEDLVKLADQLKTTEGQHCFAQSTVNTQNLLAQSCGVRGEQHIQEGT